MKSSELKGVVNDLLHLGEDFNPIVYVFIQNKLEADLLDSTIIYPEQDDVWKFYKDKITWFQNRIISLKGNLLDFESAGIRVFGHEERAKIIYKGKIFEGRISLNKKNSSDYSSYSIEDWFSWKEN